MERRLVMGMRNSPYTTVFRHLRTNVLKQLREKKWTSLAIVAATPDCGKTFVAANLGIALAMEVNQTVLIVDADLRNPEIGWYFGLEEEKGLLDYLYDDIPIEDLLINPGFDRLVLIPGRHTTEVSSELLGLPKMSALVHELKSRYQSRIILFDLPPLLTSDDALLFMPHYDAVLLVVEEGKTTRDELDRALSLLEEIPLAGIILNKVSASSCGQQYQYSGKPHETK